MRVVELRWDRLFSGIADEFKNIKIMQGITLRIYCEEIFCHTGCAKSYLHILGINSIILVFCKYMLTFNTKWSMVSLR